MNEEKLREASYKLQAMSYELRASGSRKKAISYKSKAYADKFIPAFNKFNLRLIAQSSKLITRSVLLVACSLWLAAISSCGVYKFNDTGLIPADVKTIKIFLFENKARYINPQLSPQLTDALNQKISNQTKLTRTTSDDANWQISGTVTNYSVSFSAISGKQTTQNNLTVGVHVKFRDNTKDKTDEFDVSRDFPFSANLTLTQAESSLQSDIIKNLSDEIFNHIFSNW